MIEKSLTERMSNTACVGSSVVTQFWRSGRRSVERPLLVPRLGRRGGTSTGTQVRRRARN